MAGSLPNGINFGLFIPTTPSLNRDVDPSSPEFKAYITRLGETVNNIALAMNYKDSGIYYLQEFINGQVYVPSSTSATGTSESALSRQVFRTVVDFGALQDGTATPAKSVAHNIDMTDSGGSALPFTFTRMYGAASYSDATPTVSTQSFLPLPYVSAASVNANIQLDADQTNVTLTTHTDYSAYTRCYIVLEYLKN